mmetsp:Transcript_42646/g.100025  ORF Transcript_42646/g.100025 Transcript_42646/m.100025 type:complete len:212 (-) Transcript_42646:594-1229(-)
MTEPDPWAGWHPDGWKSDAICACGQILGRGCVCLMVPDMARRTPDGSGFEEYQDWELERLASGYEKRQRRLVARSWKESELAAARERAILEAQQWVRESDAPYEMARRLVESVTVPDAICSFCLARGSAIIWVHGICRPLSDQRGVVWRWPCRPQRRARQSRKCCCRFATRFAASHWQVARGWERVRSRRCRSRRLAFRHPRRCYPLPAHR